MAGEWADVIGESYRYALDAMRITSELIEQREGKGFESKEEAYAFAEQIRSLIRVYSPMHRSYAYVAHTGELLTKSAWYELYANILFFKYEDVDGKIKKMPIGPERFADTNNARALSEQDDGRRNPLYHRHYYQPRGYYDEVMGTFNVARPIRHFAKQTGADTSHIYTLIQHLAGANTPYLLAWLREKMMNPMRKTEVVPVFISEENGTGKSTFGEVICQALFEPENVIVSDQYDSSARFNADYADALVVCMEEKKQDDRRNDASAIKSRVTASTIRKEQKGVDPIYQKSYTDFVMTTNNEVAIKFDSAHQRRFMVMDCDENFTRSKSELADEVFTKLYGFNGNGDKVGDGLREDGKTIEQFKWELLNNAKIAETSPRDFIKTEAYERQFAMPRTNENVEIEALIKTLAPFIQQSLLKRQRITDVILPGEEGEMAVALSDITHAPEGFVFYRARDNEPDRVAINRLAVFADIHYGKSYPHSVVERALIKARKWLRDEYGVALLGRTEPPSNGFKAVGSRMRMSPTAWFCLESALGDIVPYVETRELGIAADGNVVELKPRIGERVRYNEYTFQPDAKGTLETLNELKPGASNRSKENAEYLDTFLLECDSTTGTNLVQERQLLKTGITEIRAEDLYVQRLRVQSAEADRLFKEQIACRVVYSGSKSLHILVRVDPAPLNLDERRWLFAYLCKTLSTKLEFDPQVGDPTRLTRAPITCERITYRDNVKVIGEQRLLYENWAHVYKLHWRPAYEAWVNQPKDQYEQKGKSMLPSKEIYRDAARAFMEGTFFTDSRWNGKRQACFFPAYRIVRALGYTYEQVWDEVKDQVKGYYKVEDRAYWVSRQNSEIIRAIESDLSE